MREWLIEGGRGLSAEIDVTPPLCCGAANAESANGTLPMGETSSEREGEEEGGSEREGERESEERARSSFFLSG